MTQRNTLYLYSTTVSDTGYVRPNNQDSSFAGERLIAICDGMGGHAGGDTASTIAIRSLAHLEKEPEQPQTVGEVASLLETSVIAAHDAIVGKAKNERRLSGMGTTVTAVTLVEDHWVLAHIGDSRAYLLRNGRIIHATKDHSYVQHLIDTGHITLEEAKNHPQRNVVMRVLGDFDIDPRPDISVRKAQPGDRWLLCSDGVSGLLSDETIRETLETVTNPLDCAQQLVGMALKAGSTDNCTAVIADATIPLNIDESRQRHQIPLVGGAVSADLNPIADILGTTVMQAPHLRREYAKSPARKAAELSNGAFPSFPVQEQDAQAGNGESADAGSTVDGGAGKPGAGQEAAADGSVNEAGGQSAAAAADGSGSYPSELQQSEVLGSDVDNAAVDGPVAADDTGVVPIVRTASDEEESSGETPVMPEGDTPVQYPPSVPVEAAQGQTGQREQNQAESNAVQNLPAVPTNTVPTNTVPTNAVQTNVANPDGTAQSGGGASGAGAGNAAGAGTISGTDETFNRRLDTLAREAEPDDQQTEGDGQETPLPAIAVPVARKGTDDTVTPDTSEIPVVVAHDGTEISDPNDPAVMNALKNQKIEERNRKKARRRRRRGIVIGIIVLVIAAICGVFYFGWNWSQSQYYIGESDGKVAIYQGVNTNIFGYRLSHVVKTTDIDVDDVTDDVRQELERGITGGTSGDSGFKSSDEAERHLSVILESGRNQTPDSTAPSSTDTSGTNSPDGTDDAATDGADADQSDGASDSAQSEASDGAAADSTETEDVVTQGSADGVSQNAGGAAASGEETP